MATAKCVSRVKGLSKYPFIELIVDLVYRISQISDRCIHHPTTIINKNAYSLIVRSYRTFLRLCKGCSIEFYIKLKPSCCLLFVVSRLFSSNIPNSWFFIIPPPYDCLDFSRWISLISDWFCSYWVWLTILEVAPLRVLNNLVFRSRLILFGSRALFLVSSSIWV